MQHFLTTVCWFDDGSERDAAYAVIRVDDGEIEAWRRWVEWAKSEGVAEVRARTPRAAWITLARARDAFLADMLAEADRCRWVPISALSWAAAGEGVSVTTGRAEIYAGAHDGFPGSVKFTGLEGDEWSVATPPILLDDPKLDQRPAVEVEPGGLPVVGKTYLCTDGVVRWVTGKGPGTYGVFWCRWLHQDSGDEEQEIRAGVWHYGGTYGSKARPGRRFRPWPGGREIPGPKKGDVVLWAGALGHVGEHTVLGVEEERQ